MDNTRTMKATVAHPSHKECGVRNVSVALLSLEGDRVWWDLRRCDQCDLSPTVTRPLPTPPIPR